MKLLLLASLAFGQSLPMPVFVSGPSVPLSAPGEQSSLPAMEPLAPAPLTDLGPGLPAAPLKRAALSTMLAVGLALGVPACGQYDPGPYPTDPGTPTSSWYVTYDNGHPIMADAVDEWDARQERQLVYELNRYRRSIGLDNLAQVIELNDLARAQSIHMRLHGYASQVNPEGDGPVGRSQRAGLGSFPLEENIATGTLYPDAGAVVQAWLAYPGMRARIEDPRWTAVGAGYHEDPATGVPYWTADFAIW